MKKLNLLLVASMVIGTLGCCVFGYDSSRLLTYLLVIPVLVGPMLLNKTKFKLSSMELFWYYLFIFFADFLGCVVNLYNTVSWYDTVVHFSSGIFSFLVGLFFIDRLDKNVKSILTKAIFGISIVCLIAVVWEIFEFGSDVLLNLDLQHNNDTGVTDTMVDMIAAFGGGIVSVIYYLVINKLSKKR